MAICLALNNSAFIPGSVKLCNNIASTQALDSGDNYEVSFCQGVGIRESLLCLFKGKDLEGVLEKPRHRTQLIQRHGGAEARMSETLETNIHIKRTQLGYSVLAYR